MRTFLKVLMYGGIILVLAVTFFFIWFKMTYPKVGPAVKIKVESTPERIAHGEYLALHVSLCIHCHSTVDYNSFGLPVIAGTYGKGGEKFGHDMAFPGEIYARNITPSNIGTWTDGELIRSITCGVNNKGKTLFNLMPYENYREMGDEDIKSIVAYLRSLPAIKNDVTPTSVDFPVSMFIQAKPAEAAPQKIPARRDSLDYGKYLVQIAGCKICHTAVDDHHEFIKGTDFGGGQEFLFPNGDKVRSVNITPDLETGIGNLSIDDFVQKFKQYDNDEATHRAVKGHEFKTMMPWLMYAGMDETDLRSIYKYLRTLKPINNKVEKFTPAGS